MPKVDKDSPEKLRPFLSHGLVLDPRGKDAVGDCPLCLKSNKFSVKIETGEWRCWSCAEKGNVYTFLNRIWQESYLRTSEKEYEELAENRRLKHWETLRSWGVARSIITTEWLLPAYNLKGSLAQLCRYVSLRGKNTLLGTPGMKQHLYGIPLFDSKKSEVYLCEGPWDAMALWESLGMTRDNGTKLVATGSKDRSLLNRSNVLATPSCSIFDQNWVELFGKKKVILAYDSDHPKINPGNGMNIPPAGNQGMQGAVRILLSANPKPTEISYLHWGDEGYDPNLPSGYDLRDLLTKDREDLGDRIKGVAEFFSKIRPSNPTDQTSTLSSEKTAEGELLEPLPCKSWEELISSWKKAMYWTDGLDTGLSILLACIASTGSVGDQLWIKMMGPPGCGKTSLAEALSVARKYVTPKSTFRGFHSGYKSDKEGTEDHGLLKEINGKTFIIKDADTLLTAPNRDQILAEARDIYDGASRTHYRHGLSRDHENIRMTMILLGTGALRTLDKSELGARFLDYKIMDKISDKLEDRIIVKAAKDGWDEAAIMTNSNPDSQQSEDVITARRLTGGYVMYLRENAEELLSRATISDELRQKVSGFGKFVAYMRARPSAKQDEVVEREFSARLVKQFLRLTRCLAVTLNRFEVDAEVVRRVRKVALDTSAGRTLRICRMLSKYESGLDLKSLSIIVMEPEEKLKSYTNFLCQIELAEYHKSQVAPGIMTKPRLRLTEKFTKLYQEVVADV